MYKHCFLGKFAINVSLLDIFPLKALHKLHNKSTNALHKTHDNYLNNQIREYILKLLINHGKIHACERKRAK